jgi:hypothetical protein
LVARNESSRLQGGARWLDPQITRVGTPTFPSCLARAWNASFVGSHGNPPHLTSPGSVVHSQFCAGRRPFGTERKSFAMPTYRIVYGDDEEVVRETYEDVEIEREDGWLVIFQRGDAISRVQEAHIQSIEEMSDK